MDAVAGGETVMIERNGVPIAKIAPLDRTVTAVQAIASMKAMLNPSQATAWLTESKKALDRIVRDPLEGL